MEMMEILMLICVEFILIISILMKCMEVKIVFIIIIIILVKIKMKY